MDRKPETSEWIEVRNSEIHGKGVFAAKTIPKGTKIIEYVGKLISKEESDLVGERQLEMAKGNESEGSVYIFELNSKFDIDGNVSWNTARLINHSCDPNCETTGDKDHVWIESTKEIKKGEELGYNYGYAIEDFEDHPCGCGSKRCVGYILDEEMWPRLRKRLRWKKKRSGWKKKRQ